jgi:hypothetical protein
VGPRPRADRGCPTPSRPIGSTAADLCGARAHPARCLAVRLADAGCQLTPSTAQTYIHEAALGTRPSG